MIEFLLGDDDRRCDLPADTTILEYLRDHESLTGTKEGCASGDCGACTVVVARPADGDLAYEPVNACIATLGSMHGKQLITVEHLQSDDGLHPVQQAMVDQHGSQCGFCTPGFIMSLFALYQRQDDLQREDIIEGLGGNLCRCTGYRPIIDAASQCLAGERSARHGEGAVAIRARLDAIAEPESGSGDGAPSIGYHRPGSSEEVARLLQEHPNARMVAGGTDLMLEVTQGLKALPALIDLCSVPELQAMELADEGFRIGAAVTHQQCRALLLEEYPELGELIERFGSRQIRSRGTLVGNVANASPIGDWPPVLLALGAVLELRSATGTRTLPIEDFFLDYRKTALADAEFIEAVRLPRRPSEQFFRAYKISKRYEDDISSVCLVIALTMDEDTVNSARIGVGGMAAIPRRATACEAALTGLDLREGSLGEAMAALDGDFSPIDDARASSAYRGLVARNLLLRLQREYAGANDTRAHGGAHYE